MKILFCTTVLPGAKRTGGEIASQWIIDALRLSGHVVDVLGFKRPGDTRRLDLGENLVGYRPIETDGAGFYQYFWLIRAFMFSEAYSSAKYNSLDYINMLKSRLSDGGVDLVILDHAQIGYLHYYIPSEIPIVFVAHNVEEAIYQEQKITAKGFRRWLLDREASTIAMIEKRLVQRAHQVWTFTRNDCDYFSASYSTSSVFAFDLPGTVSTDNSFKVDVPVEWDVGLIGTWTWEANFKGLHWFMTKVYPSLNKDIRVAIAGKGAEQFISSGVTVLGFVPNAIEFMRGCSVIAVPSVAGSGVQIKTLDAIGTGRPLVATSVAIRGISYPPKSVTVVDDAQKFSLALSGELETKNTELDVGAIDWAINRKNVFVKQVSIQIDSVFGGEIEV